VIRFGSRDGTPNGPRNGAGIDDLVERTLSRARMAREPSIVDKERVLTALRDYMDDPTGAAPHEDGAASGVRQITQDMARPVASQWGQAVLSASGRWVRPWTWVRPSVLVRSSSVSRPWSKAVPSSLAKLTLQKLVWVGAFTGGLGFWLGSQPEPVALVTPAAVSPAAVSAPAVTPAVVARAAASSESVHEVGTQSFAPLFAPNDTLASPPLVAPSEPPQSAPTQPTPPAAKPSPVGVAASPTPLHPLPRPPATAPEAAPPVPEPAEMLEPAAPAALEPSAIAPAPAPPAPRPPPSAAPVAAPSAPSGASVSPSAPSASSPSPGDAGFLEAVRIVQRAQRSLERSAPHTALLLLDDLDARFPAALLNEERLATRVLAFCAIGASARARRAAAELELRNPSSIYAARIAQSCAGSGTPSAPRR